MSEWKRSMTKTFNILSGRKVKNAQALLFYFIKLLYYNHVAGF